MSDKYVILGEWQDEEWRQLAAARNEAVLDQAPHDVRAINDRYYAGPRVHPYGQFAFNVIVDGKCRVYPTKEAAIADEAIKDDTVHEDGVGHEVDTTLPEAKTE